MGDARSRGGGRGARRGGGGGRAPREGPDGQPCGPEIDAWLEHAQPSLERFRAGHPVRRAAAAARDGAGEPHRIRDIYTKTSPPPNKPKQP
ncbi:hypothetical protein, partial [Nocardia cyriacigeorgica]|uniref:hypothetical protein n=1 Tax=Nocardia cyriacigeorgica TaxID=135487 RepID=UPI002454E95C